MADGSFYPLLEEGVPDKKKIELSTIKDNQTTVKVDLYASEKSTMADAILIETLMLSDLEKQPNGEPTISLAVSIDKKNIIEAALLDSDSKARASDKINLHEVLLASDKNPGTGKGLLAAAEEINARDDSEEKKIASELDDLNFDLPAFSEGPAPKAETVVEAPKVKKEIAAEKTVAETTVSNATVADDFSDPFADAADVPANDVPVDDVPIDDAPLDEESLDLPNFDVPSFDDGTKADGAEKTSASDDFDLPDFGGDSSSGSDDLFGDSTGIGGSSDPFADDTFASAPAASSSASNGASSSLDFEGLYDEEENNDERKTRLPVLICIACAVICVLAVLLLFFLPTKFNLMNSRSEKKTEIVKEEAAPLPPPVQKEEPLPPPPPPPAPAAKEDEIVVIQEAETVVPDLPKPEKKREPKVITYKIKWGDTLWDISAAYYKNPWRYKKIARYNGIKNPNHIVAGTYIKIPEE